MKLCRVLSAVALGWALLSAPPCRAAGTEDALEQARKRYMTGEREYAAGRYWQSAKAFEEAYDLSRKGDLLYNAARAYDRGEYYVRAIEAYEGYIKAGMPPDVEQIQKRVAELRKLLCQVSIITTEKAYVYIDGKEYYKTPMSGSVSIDSGYRRIEVRAGNRFFAKEQQFVPGEKYEFEAVFEEDRAGVPSLGFAAGQDVGEARRNARPLAIVLGLGGAFDLAGDNFPPHQAAFVLGAEYRVKEGRRLALDLGLKIPFELLQSWQNGGLLIGMRGVLFPVARLPLELVLSLDAGFAAMDYRTDAPVSSKWPCTSPSYLPSCTVYAFRLVPAVSVAYRFLSSFEMRAQLAGLELNAAKPMFSPRYTFGLQAAYRFQ